MNSSAATSRLPSVTIRRADVFAYNFVLMGLVFILDNGVTALSKGLTAQTASGIGLGGFTLLASALAYRNINGLPKSRKPASPALLVLAAIATVVFVFFAVGVLGRIA